MKLLFLVFLFLGIAPGPVRGQATLLMSDTVLNSTLRTQISPLPREVEETSALAVFGGQFWTLNDSGNEPVLYALDPVTGAIKNRMRIRNVVNNDWEELCQDGGYLYIGDFGNNSGKRRDLAIHKILKAQVRNNPDTIDISGTIAFSYPDQTDFDPGKKQTPFDCEAMVAYGDSLFLFTKDWKNSDTRVYSVPKKAGHHIARKGPTYRVNGLVTAACLDEEAGLLVLLGYQNYVPFLQLFTNFGDGNFFKANTLRVNFPGSRFCQTEGVALGKNGEVLITAENSANPQALYAFPLSKVLIFKP